MKNVSTGVLLSPPDCLSPVWNSVFRILADPIRLVVALRDRLVTAFRQPEPPFWLPELKTYNTLLVEYLEQMDHALTKLDAIAPRTWDLGHAIRKALRPIETDLSRASMFFRDPTSYSPSRHDNQIADIRRRVFETSKKFSERPLLEALREAVAAEKGVDLLGGIESPAVRAITTGQSVGEDAAIKVDWQGLLLMPPLSSAEIAEALQQPVLNVERVLRYYRGKYPACYVQDDNARPGEARFRYKMADVIPHLQKWVNKRQRKNPAKPQKAGG